MDPPSEDADQRGARHQPGPGVQRAPNSAVLVLAGVVVGALVTIGGYAAINAFSDDGDPTVAPTRTAAEATDAVEDLTEDLSEVETSDEPVDVTTGDPVDVTTTDPVDDTTTDETTEDTTDPSSVVEISDTATAPGDCLLALEYNANGLWERVECATPHAVEVVAEALTAYTDFPGEGPLDDESSTYCASVISTYYDMVDSPDVTHYSMWPTEITWDGGDRDLSCLMVAENGAMLLGSFVAGDVTVA